MKLEYIQEREDDHIGRKCLWLEISRLAILNPPKLSGAHI